MPSAEGLCDEGLFTGAGLFAPFRAEALAAAMGPPRNPGRVAAAAVCEQIHSRGPRFPATGLLYRAPAALPS